MVKIIMIIVTKSTFHLLVDMHGVKTDFHTLFNYIF